MPELVAALFQRPPFMMAQALGAKRRMFMPVFVPDECRIHRVQYWSQGDFPDGAKGDIALAVDPHSSYIREAGYPATELTTPLLEKSLGAMRIKAGADREQVEDFGGNFVTYRAPQGDSLILVAESFGVDFQLAPFIEVYWEQVGDIVLPYPETTKLMIEGTYFSQYGNLVIRDHSEANHQLQLIGSCRLNTTILAPGRTSSIEFTGVGGINIDDHLPDFDWPGDFEVSANVRTTTASLDQAAVRHVFSGGNGAAAAAFGITTGGLLGFGNEGTGFVVVGTSNIADGQWHNVKANRTNGVVALSVDNAVQATANDATHYTVASAATVGCFNLQGSIRGQWAGYMGDVRVIKPF